MKTFYLAVSLLLFVQCTDAARDLVLNPRSPAACNTSTTFPCTSEPGKCIPNSWRCDGDIDCANGEDEEKCSDTCRDDEFKCGGDQEKSGGTKAINGCIPKKWQCDGEFDCDDHSDEKDCPEIKCKEDQFKCSEFDGQFTLCIPNLWKCDGQNDCASGADEEGCHDRNCTDNDFKCRNGVCIFKSWTCDGEDDCGDGSDEDKAVCEKDHKTPCNPDLMFRCKSENGCIPLEWKCDGESDCRDHSDEEECKVETAASCSHKTEFACKTGKFCISSQWKCDGEIDCPDGSDEAECDVKKCGANEKSCSSANPLLSTATLCFPETFWCNGREDCPDGEDEVNCTTDSTMPHYKLTYFDLRGRAEVSRQLFALAGVPYEDNRLNFEQWPAFKQTTPFGQIPLLEVDGTVLAQSITIARFLARRFGYIGATDIEAAQIDSLADLMMDYHNEQKHFFPVLMGRMPGDKDALYKELYEPARDKYLPILVDKYLKKNPNGYLIGSKVSYADLMLAEHVSVYMNVLPNAFDKYPELIAHKEKVQSLPALKQWIDTRPKTSF